jgi:hypothetical protein
MGEDIFAQRKSGRMAALARLPFRFDQGLAFFLVCTIYALKN